MKILIILDIFTSLNYTSTQSKMSFNDIKDIDLSICKSSKKEEQFTQDIVPNEIAVDLNQKNIGNVLNTIRN